MERESNFEPAIISTAKCYGIMQVHPLTARRHLLEMGYVNPTNALLLDPVICTEVGIRVLVELRKYWMSEGLDSWLITVNSYFWGTSPVWDLLNKSKMMPNLEYGKGVLDLQRRYKEKGI